VRFRQPWQWPDIQPSCARARILAVPDKGTRQPEIARNLNIGVGTAGYHVASLRMDGRYKP
jgi:hypothetical protein